MEREELTHSISQMLLLGSCRTSFSQEQLQALSDLGIDTTLHPEDLLLQCITYFRKWEKVGQPFELQTEVFPVAPEEHLSVCAPNQVAFLREILFGAYPEVLSEFLVLLGQSKKLLPPEFLPEVFRKIMDQPDLYPQVLSVMGQRGYWLLQQTDQWPMPEEALNPLKNPDLPDSSFSQTAVLEQIERFFENPSDTTNISLPSGLIQNLLLLPGQSWEPAFSLNLVRWIAGQMQLLDPWNNSPLKTLLQKAARSCPPDLIPALNLLSWPTESIFWKRWKPEADRFFQIIRFRNSMHEAFSKSA